MLDPIPSCILSRSTIASSAISPRPRSGVTEYVYAYIATPAGVVHRVFGKPKSTNAPLAP